MPSRYWELLFTDEVQQAQRDAYGHAHAVSTSQPDETLGADEVEMVESRDSFYLSTVSAAGWPYIQHRGGPPGFLKVLDPSTLVFADLRGNRQLISTGNLAGNDRVALFLMDYPRRRRLKILGHGRIIDAREEPDLASTLAPPGAEKRVERVFAIRVVAFDWNCPQQITPRFTSTEVEEHVAALKRRIAELEGADDEESRSE